MKIVKLLVVLIGCLLGYNGIDASALADTEQSCGPIKVPYEITAITTVPTTGQVILAGFYENALGYKQLFLGCQKSDGTGLDATFGTCYFPPDSGAISLAGYTILGNDSDATISATANWTPTDVIIDTTNSNSIVVVGVCQDAGNATDPQQGFIARFTAAGLLDSNFGSASTITNATVGYALFGPSTLSLPATNPITPIFFNNVIVHQDASISGININRYVIVGTAYPQGIVVAIQNGTGPGGTDGQLDTTFNGGGVFSASGNIFGGVSTDSVVFNNMEFALDAAFNLNYYIAGSVQSSGILVGLQVVASTTTTPQQIVQLQTLTFGPAATSGTNKTGYLLVPGNLLGGAAGSDVVFNEIIQSSTAPNDWYLIGKMGENTAFLVSILNSGSQINSGGFNASAVSITTFGKTPGVVIINSSQLNETGFVQFSSLIQKLDTNFYISGVAGSSSFILSVVNFGTSFNPNFGVGISGAQSGYITLPYSQLGLVEAPNVTQAVWDTTITPNSFYLLSSDTLTSSPGVASTVAKILLDGTALDTTYNSLGVVPGVTASFKGIYYYVRNTNIAGASTNINVTILQTPVGQAIQLLSPTDNPLLPPLVQQISRSGFVFDMTNCQYDLNTNQIIIVGVVYTESGGNGLTNAYIARFNSNLQPDNTFGGLGYGYKNFDAFSFGGAANDPALFFSVLPADVNGNYTVCGSVYNNGTSLYDGLIAQIQNDGIQIATNPTFNNPIGYQTYDSNSLISGESGNAVLSGILQSSYNNDYYVIGMTSVINVGVQSLDSSAPYYNIGNGLIADIKLTGLNNVSYQIIPITFGLLPGGVHTQLSSFIQDSSGYFVVVANLPSSTNGSSVQTNRAGICAINNGLTSLYTPFGNGNLGYTLMDSSTFGVGTPSGLTDFELVRFETLQSLTNDDVLLLGKVASFGIEQTLVAQMKQTGVFNQRLNGTGYLLGSTDPLKQGTMTAYSENVISIVGTDGGIFIFGSGVAGGTTNLVEIALIKRYGL